MRILYLLAIILFGASCSTQKNGKDRSVAEEAIEIKEVVKSAFQSILDTNQIKGSILIYDSQLDTYYSNDFDWANRGFLPASTFKIANSIVALDLGVVASDSSISYWDGEDRWLPQWEQDLIFRDAFHLSCVPCYQEVARNIGEKRMNTYLTDMKYGDIKVDSTNIDMFWLEGDSRINQMQQIDFLRRFVKAKLPISARTHKIMKRMIVAEETEAYKLSAKSGLSNTNEQYNGWYVGYLEVDNNVCFFATNLEPKAQETFDFQGFIALRKNVTFDAFKKLKVINN